MSDPFELTLDGLHGDTIRVRFVPEGDAIESDVVDGGELFAGRLLEAFAAERIVLLDGEVDELFVSDFHLVRDLAERFGVIEPQPHPALTCRNCRHALDVDPVGADPESLLAEPPVFEHPPMRWAEAVDGVRGALMDPVRVRDARALWRCLVAPEPVLDAAVVRGLGVVELTLEDGTTLDTAESIAERMNASSDALLDVITAAYDLVQYPPRMRFGLVCPECGAVHDVPTPSIREDDPPPEAFDVLFGAIEEEGAMLDIDAFSAAVERFAAEVFEDRGVANIDVVVDEGVPPVDDSGEPLMGSYQPIHENHGGTFTDVRFEIALYYQTFVSMFAEAPYDVDAEIRETLDHEVEHHLHHLSGHDPLDAEERAEARADLERTFGKDAVRRAERDALRRELGQMGRVFFWGLLVLAIGLALLVAAGVIE